MEVEIGQVGQVWTQAVLECQGVCFLLVLLGSA